MLPQQNYGGYQPTEEEIQQNQINPLVNGLGITAAGAGGSFLIDAERRRRASGGTKDFSAAAKESVDDLGTALRVLTGRSDYDLRGKPDSPQPRITGNVPADAEFRSIRNFAESAPEQSMYSLSNTSNPFTKMAVAARDAYQPSSEDFLASMREYRTSRGQSAEGPRSSVAFQRIPSLDALRDLAAGRIPGIGYRDDMMQFRKKHGIDLMKSVRDSSSPDGKRVSPSLMFGSAMGRSASDFINNGARSLWWLVNAPQAVSDLISEEVAGRTNNFGLYGQDLFSFDEALDRKMIDDQGNPRNNAVNLISDRTEDPYLQDQIDKRRAGIRSQAGKDPIDRKRLNVYGVRRTGNNLSTLLALPSALAINAGLGLVNPVGGSDGYKAVLPSEEDPTKTRNVLGEVASKYILGRRGDILPWEEFKKVRPDVSKADYMAYKGYKYNKGVDLNPLDGDWNLGGIAKGTDDGIEGGEIMFLGKHMPTDTVILPTLAAAGGAALGAAFGKGGSLNAIGIQEGIDRQLARKNPILSQYGLKTTDLPDRDELKKLGVSEDDLNQLDAIDKEVERRMGKQRFLEGDFVGSAEGANKVGPDAIRNPKQYQTGERPAPGMFGRLGLNKNRMRRINPITSGLIGGTAALAGASLIGHENERRRREEKIRERQERGY